MKKVNIERNELLLDQLVLVDGLPGNGKTLFSSIIPSLSKIELLSYSDQIEAICEYFFLGKIKLKEATTLIRMFADLKLYNQSMGRNVNFRKRDLSSVYNYPNSKEYENRLNGPGDENIIPIIKKNKPVLHLATHNKLGYSKPLWSAFEEKLFFLEIIRHPAYMITQISKVLMEDLVENVRNWSTQFSYKNKAIPYFAMGWEADFLNLNPTERSIRFINDYIDKVKKFKSDNHQRSNQVLTIPFELFVLEPKRYVKKIIKFLNVKATKLTNSAMLKQNVPRNKIADGIDLEIYRRCGWKKPIDKLDESDELDLRKKNIQKLASKKHYELFNYLCESYEKEIWSP